MIKTNNTLVINDGELKTTRPIVKECMDYTRNRTAPYKVIIPENILPEDLNQY